MTWVTWFEHMSVPKAGPDRTFLSGWPHYGMRCSKQRIRSGETNLMPRTASIGDARRIARLPLFWCGCLSDLPDLRVPAVWPVRNPVRQAECSLAQRLADYSPFTRPLAVGGEMPALT